MAAILLKSSLFIPVYLLNSSSFISSKYVFCFRRAISLFEFLILYSLGAFLGMISFLIARTAFSKFSFSGKSHKGLSLTKYPFNLNFVDSSLGNLSLRASVNSRYFLSNMALLIAKYSQRSRLSTLIRKYNNISSLLHWLLIFSSKRLLIR